jgi:hypothetical protein
MKGVIDDEEDEFDDRSVEDHEDIISHYSNDLDSDHHYHNHDGEAISQH